MAIVLKDRVKETTNTTGTSDFVLAGAVGGFQAFSAIGNGNTTYYAAVDNTTGDWEIGYGQYSTTGPTLTRATILASSAAGAKISFSAGPKDVFVTYPAGKAIYEELSGNTLIDGGPLTVIGSGVTSYTTFSAALGELYANINSFAQIYAQNLNDGTEASADFVAYNDLGDGVNNFVDMGINSSNYSSATYPIFTPGSAYVFNDGGELFLGSATDDVVLFAGGVDTTDEAVRIDKTTKNVTTVADVDVGGDVNATGGTFTAAVTTTASMVAPGTTEFVTREYVDNATSNGFHVHTPVLVATTGNLTATYNNGTLGVGATLTNSGTQVALEIDGVSMATNDRVLVWQQTSGLQNGVYVVTTVGSGSTNWVLTRSSDANTSSEGDPNSLGGGDYFFVDSGDTLGYHSFICTNTAAIVFGTTAITFNEFSSVPEYIGGTNITVDGQTINVSGTIAATLGGTGTSTVATGDLLYGSGTNTWGKLAAGSAYKSLVMNAGGTNVEWNAVALDQSGSVSGALPATNGGTGISSYAQGEMLFANTANSLDKVTANTTTTKKFLSQTGTGTAGQAPTWAQPAASDITGLAPSATTDTTDASNITSGTLPAARLNGSYTGITGVGTLTAGTWNASTIGPTYGGTGFTSYAVGDLLYADTTTSLAKLADVATGSALISGGVGSAPSWGKIGLATHVSGTLPIANGGTNGSATPAAGAVAYGTGTAYDFTAAGTSGQLLTSAGTSAPTWTSQSSLSVGTATNLAGGGANQVPYQTGSGATSFVTAPTTAGTALTWNGSALVWQTAGSATLQNDTSTNSTYYPVFATATSGSFTDARVSSTKLTFNPNTGTLSATTLSGAISSSMVTTALGFTPPSNTGSGASGTWGIRITGFANAGTPRLYASDAAYNYDSANPYYMAMTYDGSRWLLQVTPGTPAAVRVAYADNSGALNGYAASTFVGQQGASYYQANTWIQFNGTYGCYWPSSGAGTHWNPNTSSTYTGFVMQGSKNSYGGFYDTYSAVNGVMYDSAGNGGVYREANGRWYFYYHLGNNCMGIGTSGTSSSYSVYADKAAYLAGGAYGASMSISGGFTIDTPGSGYGRFNNWVNINGYFGFYSSNNSAHFYPNNVTYGAWRVDGSRNGWTGIHFGDSGNTLMMNSNALGVHREGYGWTYYWSGGTLYCFKNSTGGGTQATVYDTSNSSSSNAGNGYQRLATGILIQWGFASVGAARYIGTTISYPVAFSSIYSVTCTTMTNTTSAYTAGGASLASIGTSSFYAKAGTFENVAINTGFYWIAIGT